MEAFFLHRPHRKASDHAEVEPAHLLPSSVPFPGSGPMGRGPQGSKDQGKGLVPWTKGQIPGLGWAVLGSCPTPSAPQRSPRRLQTPMGAGHGAGEGGDKTLTR